MASKVAAAHDRDPADLVGLISDHAGETGAEAALALASLTGSDSGCEAAEDAGAVPALLAYVSDASGDAEGRRNCARAVGHIARHSEGARARLCAAGAIDVLAACLADADAPMDTRAAAAEALDNLARGAAPQGDESRMRAIAATGVALPALVDLLGSDSRHVREVAAAATYALTLADGTERRGSLSAAGAVGALKTVAGKGGSAAWWSRQSLEHIEGAGAARAA